MPKSAFLLLSESKGARQMQFANVSAAIRSFRAVEEPIFRIERQTLLGNFAAFMAEKLRKARGGPQKRLSACMHTNRVRALSSQMKAEMLTLCSVAAFREIKIQSHYAFLHLDSSSPLLEGALEAAIKLNVPMPKFVPCIYVAPSPDFPAMAINVVNPSEVIYPFSSISEAPSKYSALEILDDSAMSSMMLLRVSINLLSSYASREARNKLNASSLARSEAENSGHAIFNATKLWEENEARNEVFIARTIAKAGRAKSVREIAQEELSLRLQVSNAPWHHEHYLRLVRIINEHMHPASECTGMESSIR